VADCLSCLLAKSRSMRATTHYLSALVAETLHLKLKFLQNPNQTLWRFLVDVKKE
jgi:hypothetical protein